MPRTLIKNGTVVTATDQYKGDVLVEDEKIALIGTTVDVDRRTDERNLLVLNEHVAFVLIGRRHDRPVFDQCSRHPKTTGISSLSCRCRTRSRRGRGLSGRRRSCPSRRRTESTPSARRLRYSRRP